MSDDLVVSGHQATGTTGVTVTNAGGTGAETTGNGVEVVKAINGATTAGAFTLDNPDLRAGDFNYRLFEVGNDWFLGASFIRQGLVIIPTTPKVVNITTLEFAMEETVSAADANRRFSLLLRGVREGRSYVVTSHGKPVARLIPASKYEDVVARARETLLARLEKQPVIQAGRWTRDELYEDER